jgi:hypothetical protein
MRTTIICNYKSYVNLLHSRRFLSVYFFYETIEMLCAKQYVVTYFIIFVAQHDASLISQTNLQKIVVLSPILWCHSSLDAFLYYFTFLLVSLLMLHKLSTWCIEHLIFTAIYSPLYGLE